MTPAHKCWVRFTFALIFAVMCVMPVLSTEMITIDHSGQVSRQRRSFVRRETPSSKRHGRELASSKRRTRSSTGRELASPKRRARSYTGISALKSTLDPSQTGADLWLDLRGRAVNQSSTLYQNHARLAADGKDGVRWNSCSATRIPGWWEVDLGGRYEVAAVHVLRRAWEDKKGKQLQIDSQAGPFSIYVDQQQCAEKETIPLPAGDLVTEDPEKLSKEIPCKSTGRKIKLMKQPGARGGEFCVCEVKVKATLVRNWALISNNSICEQHFWLRDRMKSQIRSECENDDSNETLAGCKKCCFQDSKCHAIDYYEDSKVCMRYGSRCFKNMTSPAHHGGSSYSLDP
eukprot:TRINITY_DN7650_c0_g1_i5.p1 TRINITY_DN7650_c0_g1~~TRINITY_DN7650_c0_g1_i5.p1  ORF type:complete len:345 (-),score=30.05 TRINITY_DN7650_c0_g1_i5:34-1068(-)